jgi:HEAT repeat protein
LTQALASPDAKTRGAAARELWRRGAEAAPAVPALAKVLHDSDPLVRAYAARAIGATGTADRAAATALSQLLLDPDRRVSASAAEALKALLPDPQLIGDAALQALSEDHEQTLDSLIETLVAGGERSVPILIEALEAKKYRYWAALILAELGPVAAPALPALVRALQDERPEVKLQALVALGEIGEPAQSALPAIRSFLTPETPLGLQYAAAFALANVGTAQSLPALAALTKSDDPFLKAIAVWGRARLDNSPATMHETVDVLVESLQSKDPRVRQVAARAIAELHPDRELLDEKLFAALADADPTVRANVADAIASLGPAAVPRLIEGLKDVRSQELALESLRRLGEDARDAAPAVAALILQLQQTTGNDALLAAALITLGAVGQPPAELQPTLKELFAHSDPAVRRGAYYVSGKMGAAAQDLIPGLREAVQSPDEATRLVAVWALLHVGEDDPQTVAIALPLLTSALKSPGELVRIEAAQTLGELGPRAASAADALRELASDPSPDVRAVAEDALKLIAPH